MVHSKWDGNDLRSHSGCRRRIANRRAQRERRFDTRVFYQRHKRGLRGWFRSLTNARLGVDRRKGEKQRIIKSRRQLSLKSLLSKEELDDLLS